MAGEVMAPRQEPTTTMSLSEYNSELHSKYLSLYTQVGMDLPLITEVFFLFQHQQQQIHTIIEIHYCNDNSFRHLPGFSRRFMAPK